MKRILIFALCIAAATLCASCGKNVNGGETAADDSSAEVTSAPDATGFSGPTLKPELAYDYDLSEYITLPDHSAPQIAVNLFDVTDEDVQMAIDEDLSNAGSTQKVDGAAQSGDTVTYKSTGVRLDTNETFEDSRERSVVIGSDAYLEGFGDNFIGAATGDTVVFTYTFPSDFYNTKIAGVTVEYTANVTAVSHTTPAELNDGFVASLGINGVNDVESYRAYMKDSLEQTAKLENEQAIRDAIYDFLDKGSRIVSYPEKEYGYYIDIAQKNAEAQSNATGVQLSEFIKTNYGSEQAFDDYKKDYAEQHVKKDMLTFSIAREYGVKVDRAEYEEELNYGYKQYAQTYGITSAADFEKQFSHELTMGIMLKTALDEIAKNAVVV